MAREEGLGTAVPRPSVKMIIGSRQEAGSNLAHFEGVRMVCVRSWTFM